MTALKPVDAPGWSRSRAAGIVATTVVLRLVAVAGFQLARYVDSAEYDRLDLSGRWRRPWTTPLLYRFLPDDWDAPTVFAQALIGALAWSALAIALAARIRDGRVRIGVAAVVIGLSVTTTVTNWDAAKLSESLAISSTVLLIAAWSELLRRTTLGTASAVIAVTLPWLFVRQSALPIAWAVALASIVVAVLAIRAVGGVRDRAVPLVAVASLTVLLCGVATISYGRNREVLHTNLTAILSQRIAPDADQLEWFLDEGMPTAPGGATDFGSLERDPAFRRWLERDGAETYARFLLTHPWHTLTGPIRDLFTERATFLKVPPHAEVVRIDTPSMLSPGEAYGGSRPVLPAPVEALLADPAHTGGITLLLVGTAAWMALDRRRPGADSLFAAAVGLLAVVGLWSAWHGATTELARLALVPAIMLRIALILQLAVLADRRIRAGNWSAYPRSG